MVIALGLALLKQKRPKLSGDLITPSTIHQQGEGHLAAHVEKGSYCEQQFLHDCRDGAHAVMLRKGSAQLLPAKLGNNLKAAVPWELLLCKY